MSVQALIDDFSNPARASNGQPWRFVSDRVMGGVSMGYTEHDCVAGRAALRMHGEVSLENNGGFVQVNLDLADGGGQFDASDFAGVSVTLRGDGERYAINLRTAQLSRPWQSYRCEVTAEPAWRELRLPFDAFEAHRTDRPLDTQQLRRIGLIAIGEARSVDVAIAELRFFRG